MANQLLSLLDITKRNGTDSAVGLIEEVITYAPEMASVMGRPIPGTTYKTRVRTSLPTASFRTANAGSSTVKSGYAQKLAQCYIIDGQMQADKAVADSPEEGGAAGVLADEASGIIRGTGITIGTQFYYGDNATSSGFSGLQASVDPSMVVDATGGSGGDAANAAKTTSVYLIWNDLQGVHFIFGNNSGLNMLPEWRIQQVLDGSGNPYTAYVNALTGWLGLSVNHTKSICRIKNLTYTGVTAKPLTDALLAKAYSLFPIGQKPNMILVNRDGNYSLQNSRSSVTQAVFKLGAAADYPTNSPSIPGVGFTLTDSIISTEAAS